MSRISILSADLAFDCDDHDTIMRAAVRAGLQFPYECNVGSCGNCRFELIEGDVIHERRDSPAWSDRDRARNRYLGCQARPLANCTIKVRLEREGTTGEILRPRKNRATLITVRDITHDIREFRFSLERPAPFFSGQYALLQLPAVEGARAYSMSNTGEVGQEWHFQIKLVPGGIATDHLFHHLRPGSVIDVDGPYGKAFLREESPRDILCIAGGSGLSPMMSIARKAATSPALAKQQIHFIYGGRYARDICGEPMLRELPGFGVRLHYHPAVSMPNDDSLPERWEGRIGFVHDIAQELFPERLADFEVYFAGPPPMVDALMRMLIAAKVPPAQIHYDQFY